jgi:pantoate--beta-alanine ligase
MYPPGFATSVTVGEVSAPLEGVIRPHFFGGVATVVAKLLLQTLPDVAVFGEKDYQQLLVIRRLAADLDIPVRILAGETVREPDGLAMSSRNAYLPAEARRIAGRLNVLMREAIAAMRAGAAPAQAAAALEAALGAAGFDAVEYAAVADAGTLAPLAALDRPARLLVAVRLGPTRLIDNMAI